MENLCSDTKVTEATLITTKEAAEILNVSTSTLKNWRKRKLFGCVFFSADVKKNGAWMYDTARVLQLKAVYQKGILQNMYKLARHFDEVCLFDICDSNGGVFKKKNFIKGMEVADILTKFVFLIFATQMAGFLKRKISLKEWKLPTF